ncbi:MAG: ferredoxin [Betaproteobacteria bacterium]|nr:ferredoxin [Betaproteobacteria bacterium]
MSATAVHRAPANPCMTCGACCTSFVVPFYWREADDAGGRVPAALTEPLPPHRLCMAGTNSKSPRCIALEGEVGKATSCSIYADRPSPCRAFTRHGEAGADNDSCTRARARYGLPALGL